MKTIRQALFCFTSVQVILTVIIALILLCSLSDKGIYHAKTFANTYLLPRSISPNAAFSFPENRDFNFLSNNTYAYSAYMDELENGEKLIRILGYGVVADINSTYSCNFFSKDKKYLYGTAGRKEPFRCNRYHKKSKIVAMFLFCPLTQDVPVKYIGFTTDAENLIEIQENSLNPVYDVAACVKPMHEFKWPLKLIEWLEFNKLMGVQHFTFFNMSSDQRTVDVMAFYQNQGLVNVEQWHLKGKGVMSWGQQVTATDCVYRYKNVSKYVLAMDLDEFLKIPEEHESFVKYFDDVFHQKQAGTIEFKSKFSFLNWDAEPTQDSVEKELQVPCRIKNWPARQKKFVHRPNCVVESGVHWPEKMKNTNGCRLVNLERKEGAYYFHYRPCDKLHMNPRGNSILENKQICNVSSGMDLDDSLKRNIGDKVVAAVKNVLRELDKNVGDLI